MSHAFVPRGEVPGCRSQHASCCPPTQPTLLTATRHRTHAPSRHTPLCVKRWLLAHSRGSHDGSSSGGSHEDPERPPSATRSKEGSDVTPLERFLDDSHDSSRLNNPEEETLEAPPPTSSKLVRVFKSAIDSLRASTDEPTGPLPDAATVYAAAAAISSLDDSTDAAANSDTADAAAQQFQQQQAEANSGSTDSTDSTDSAGATGSNRTSGATGTSSTSTSSSSGSTRGSTSSSISGTIFTSGSSSSGSSTPPALVKVDELDRFLNSDLSDSRANNHPEEVPEPPPLPPAAPALAAILSKAQQALSVNPDSTSAEPLSSSPVSSTLESSGQAPTIPLSFFPDVLTPATPKQGRSYVNTWSDWWGRLMYSYYNWRQDITSDLTTLFIGFLGLVFVAGSFKNALVDEEAGVGIYSILEDMYEVIVLSFGQDLPDASAGPNAQIFSVIVAAVGLAAFALVLALVEQVVLEVIDANVRKGGTVFEQDHVLIVGWCTSQRDLELVQKSLQQVCFAFGNDGGTTIVVLTKRAKLDMEAYFRREIPEAKRYGSRLVFRQGSPLLPRDLMTVAAHKAAGIIIVSDQSRSPVEADAQSLRCAILFDELGELVRSQTQRPNPHVVIDMRTTDVVPLLGYSCLNQVIPLSTAKRCARRIANMVRHPYISIVTQQLLNFDNSSNHFVHSFPSLVGLRFKELAFRFPTAIIMGVVQHTGVTIHKPYGDYVVQPGDELIMIRPTSIKYEDFQPIDNSVVLPEQTWQRPPKTTKPLRSLPPLRLLDGDLLSSVATNSTTGIASYDGNNDSGSVSAGEGVTRKTTQAAATVSYGRSRNIRRQAEGKQNGSGGKGSASPEGGSSAQSSSGRLMSQSGSRDTLASGQDGDVKQLRNPAEQLLSLLMNRQNQTQESIDASSVNMFKVESELANVIPVEYLETDQSPLNLLVCGWSDQSFMRHLICELDHGHFALPAGSNIVFCNQHSRADSLQAAVRVIQEPLTNCSLSHIRMDPLLKYELAAFDITQFKCAIVLCDVLWIDPDMNANNGVDELEEIDVLRLDALVMLAQLNIRKILEDLGQPTINIICQKVGNEGMTRFEDRRRLPLGISVNFTSYAAKLLTQVLYSPKVLSAFSYGEVADIRIQDASELATEGEMVSFWQLVARAQMQNEVLLGYYRVPNDLASPLETVINPVRDRDKPRVWNNGDKCLKFLVLCDNFDGIAVSMRSVDPATKQAPWVALRSKNSTDSESSMGSGSLNNSVDGVGSSGSSSNGTTAVAAGGDRLRSTNGSR